MRATAQQAVVLETDESRRETLLRELLRFGVTEVLLVGARPPLLALPRPLSISCCAAPVRGQPSPIPAVTERYLLCEAGAVLDFNLARLLMQTAGCSAMRDGAELGVRLVHGASEPCPITIPALPLEAPRPALFLDRDGTINVDHGYVGTRERFEWIDGALDAVRMATEAGWHVFIVTNQSGIARGLYDEAALDALHDWMVDTIRAAGGTVDDLRYCPFHEEAKLPRYRQASSWRKPAPGMILDLIDRWSLDPARCVLVGDQPSDMGAARAAGIAGRRFPGGNLAAFVAPLLQSQLCTLLRP